MKKFFVKKKFVPLQTVRKKYSMKKIVLALCLLMFVSSLQAQMPPTISDNWRGSGIGYSDARDRGLTIRSLRPYSQNDERSTVNPPLTPATLLLLGLGSVAVGGTVYRNTKKRQ
jgi:hypothetical protein